MGFRKVHGDKLPGLRISEQNSLYYNSRNEAIEANIYSTINLLKNFGNEIQVVDWTLNHKWNISLEKRNANKHFIWFPNLLFLVLLQLLGKRSHFRRS